METKYDLKYEELKIDFISKNPFCIFKIDNFYNEDLYQSIKEELPNIDNLEQKNIKEYNNKFYFNSEDKIYEDLIYKSKSLQVLHKKVFSNDFINFFYKKLFLKFLYARKSNLNSFIHLLKIPKFAINKDDKLKSFFYLKIKPIIEFSYIKEKGKVVPHTDNRNKLLSLLTYFPEYEESNNIYKKKENDLGTQFWFSNKKNYFNEHLKDEAIENSFKKNSKKIYKTPFIKKTLFGFIKNEYSWHSVDTINVQKDYIRKSINISLLIDK